VLTWWAITLGTIRGIGCSCLSSSDCDGFPSWVFHSFRGGNLVKLAGYFEKYLSPWWPLIPHQPHGVPNRSIDRRCSDEGRSCSCCMPRAHGVVKFELRAFECLASRLSTIHTCGHRRESAMFSVVSANCIRCLDDFSDKEDGALKSTHHDTPLMSSCLRRCSWSLGLYLSPPCT
jgi:hypothetical protein